MRRSLLIILADQSGSMRPAWSQVQSALCYMLQRSFRDGASATMAVELILYNASAVRLQYTQVQRFWRAL